MMKIEDAYERVSCFLYFGGCFRTEEGAIESVTHEDAGSGNCVHESQTLQEMASIHEFFHLVATETLALFEHLEFEFLTEYDAKVS